MYNPKLHHVESPLLWLIKGCSHCPSASSPVWPSALRCRRKPSVQVDAICGRLVWKTEALPYTSLVPINAIGLCINYWLCYIVWLYLSHTVKLSGAPWGCWPVRKDPAQTHICSRAYDCSFFFKVVVWISSGFAPLPVIATVMLMLANQPATLGLWWSRSIFPLNLFGFFHLGYGRTKSCWCAQFLLVGKTLKGQSELVRLTRPHAVYHTLNQGWAII